MYSHRLRRRMAATLPAIALAGALALTGLALQQAASDSTASASDRNALLAALAPPLAPASIALAYAPESAQPLGKPAPLTVPSTSYAFLNASPNGTPVAYDPCRPIHYVTREANVPAEGARLIREAVAAVSAATGLVFINDGTTTEAPAAKHSSFQPDRYGNRPAPVLIAWATPAEEPSFTLAARGIVLGVTGSEAFQTRDGRFTYVSGQATLNGPGLQKMIKTAGIDAARGLIEHELGHLVGLEHVSDTTQLMNPTMTPGISDYQPGDLTGLAILGQGKCEPGL
ncbi:peptidase [Arthrobacter sp. 2MCAF14]|uniref:peptidase n=1 Tax=Arthrobacter sp. 2MCAF14 TaxID=3232982 RepID=UPI003F8EBD11